MPAGAHHGHLRGPTQTVLPSQPLGGWLRQGKTLLQAESTETWGLCISWFCCSAPFSELRHPNRALLCMIKSPDPCTTSCKP